MDHEMSWPVDLFLSLMHRDVHTTYIRGTLYRVSIKSFPDYKQLLQENYVEYKHIFLPLLKLVSNKMVHLHTGGFTCSSVFDATFPNRWIGRDGPTPWPPLSPDITHLYFLFVGMLRTKRFRHQFQILQILTLRRLMSYIYIYIYIYIYMEHPFLMFLDHTQRRSTVGRTPLDE